ncbi:hypothetical protein VCHA50P415_20734 [Vibrio chagasii]|nr:hypothetical protein VCHA50P415_20734 [Vibrio chagasii]
MEVRLFGVARDICSNYFAIGDSLLMIYQRHSHSPSSQNC